MYYLLSRHTQQADVQGMCQDIRHVKHTDTLFAGDIRGIFVKENLRMQVEFRGVIKFP